MNTQVVVLAAVTVLLHAPAGRGLSVRSQNSGHQLDDGDGTGMERVSEERDVSNQDLDAGNLVLVEESVGNGLHDIRRREARSKKWSSKRQGGSGGESGMDLKREANEKGVMKDISDFLEPKKEMIINFMKPIFDRIKHKPKKPSPGDSSDLPASPAPPTPAPSSTPSDSDASTPPDSDTSTSSDSESSSPSDASNSSDSDATDSGASNSTNSDASTPSDSPYSSTPAPTNIFPLFPFSFSKCGANERHRSVNTLSLLFPDLESNKGEQPFVFLPFTNTLMRVVEQQIVRESQDSRRRLND